jgi:hypothetical protein
MNTNEHELIKIKVAGSKQKLLLPTAYCLLPVILVCIRVYSWFSFLRTV